MRKAMYFIGVCIQFHGSSQVRKKLHRYPVIRLQFACRIFVINLKKSIIRKIIFYIILTKHMWWNHHLNINIWTCFSVHDVQATRKARINKVCTDLNVSRVPIPIRMNFVLADKNHGVLYGEIPKVGATSWLYLLISLTGKVKVDFQNRDRNKLIITDRQFLWNIGLIYVNGLSEAEVGSVLTKYYKFVFVRHPFTRILSAFRDKINPGDTYYHRTYGAQILRLFRRSASSTTKSLGVGVTFPEFVQYIIYLHKHKQRFDEHWAPYHTLIFPCQIKYDFIGKLENLEEETEQVLLSGFHLNSSNVKFPTETAKHKTGSSAEAAAKAYKEIPEEHIEQLREVYKLDFMLFDYDPRGFL